MGDPARRAAVGRGWAGLGGVDLALRQRLDAGLGRGDDRGDQRDRLLGAHPLPGGDRVGAARRPPGGREPALGAVRGRQLRDGRRGPRGARRDPRRVDADARRPPRRPPAARGPLGRQRADRDARRRPDDPPRPRVLGRDQRPAVRRAGREPRELPALGRRPGHSRRHRLRGALRPRDLLPLAPAAAGRRGRGRRRRLRRRAQLPGSLWGARQPLRHLPHLVGLGDRPHQPRLLLPVDPGSQRRVAGARRTRPLARASRPRAGSARSRLAGSIAGALAPAALDWGVGVESGSARA